MSSVTAVSIVPGQIALLVARANGALEPLHQLTAELPPDAVRAGLQPPNVPDVAPVAERLAALVAQAGGRRGRDGLVAVLVPDAAVRMALAPLEGTPPRGAEGEAMARWALADLLPSAAAKARIDWAVVGEHDAPDGAGWLLALGADVDVVREYEAVVEAAGLTPGRVVPLTLALAVGVDDEANGDDAPDGPAGTTAGAAVAGARARDALAHDAIAARLVISGVGGQVACLLEARGVPRLHRAWRGGAPDLTVELPAIERYAATRLGLSIGEAVVAGPDEWRGRAAHQCSARGWAVHQPSAWTAHLGAVRP